MNQQCVSLDTIGNGALVELFGAELQRIISNITDPNTDTSTKRVMKIEIKFKPNRDRDVAEVDISCSSKLAGIMTVATTLYVGKVRGEYVAVESDPRQSKLFDQEPRPLAAVSQFSNGQDGQ